MSDVICVRCQSTVPANQTDFSAEGVVCRSCMIVNVDVPALERDLARSTARKRVVTGIVMLAAGITLLSLGLSVGSFVLVPTGLLLGGLFELARGLSGPKV